MIKVIDKYAIEVGNHCYTTGKIFHDKKTDKDILMNTGYHSFITGAISDIAERTARDRLYDKNLTLRQALEEIKSVYYEFSNKIDDLTNQLKGNLK